MSRQRREDRAFALQLPRETKQFFLLVKFGRGDSRLAPQLSTQNLEASGNGLLFHHCL